MRIIAGKFKGRLISAGNDGAVRPTADRVRENIFNIIQSRTAGADVLDLFAGSGALGIEAASRGARSVEFVDKSPDSCKIIKNNLQKLGIGYDIINLPAVEFLQRASCCYDIIFIDPPYSDNADDVLKIISEKNLLNADGLIIYEHSADKKNTIPQGLTVKDERKYGTVKISLLRSNGNV